MKTSILICIRSLCLFSLLICLPAFVHAQERLQIADLFSKYGEQKDVTRVEDVYKRQPPWDVPCSSIII